MLNYSLKAGFLCDPTVAVHHNSSQLSTMIMVISGINIALSITATLGNALILVVFNRESSLNQPSKLFLRCLAFSDLCVGLLLQPVVVLGLLSAVHHRWNLCRICERLWYALTIILTVFSLQTLIAISVDRLLALLLGIRYRQVVTIKRARMVVALVLLISIVNYVLQLTNLLAFLAYTALVWLIWLITSTYCYVRIYVILRNLIQAQVTPQGQPNGTSPLNVSRYKKTVSTALWVFAAMIICYVPFGLGVIVTASFELSGAVVVFNFSVMTLVYLNSSLNPMLYCWKIREVRNAVKEILSNLGLCKLCRD